MIFDIEPKSLLVLRLAAEIEDQMSYMAFFVADLVDVSPVGNGMGRDELRWIEELPHFLQSLNLQNIGHVVLASCHVIVLFPRKQQMGFIQWLPFIIYNVFFTFLIIVILSDCLLPIHNIHVARDMVEKPVVFDGCQLAQLAQLAACRCLQGRQMRLLADTLPDHRPAKKKMSVLKACVSASAEEVQGIQEVEQVLVVWGKRFDN